MSRSDSAKRFAKMFIGSNVEHKEFDDMLSDEYKETQSTLSNTSSDKIKIQEAAAERLTNVKNRYS